MENKRPWLWSEMMGHYKYAKGTIDSLTDEGWYEFTLTGTFEDISGQNADIQTRRFGANRAKSDKSRNSIPPTDHLKESKWFQPSSDIKIENKLSRFHFYSQRTNFTLSKMTVVLPFLNHNHKLALELPVPNITFTRPDTRDKNWIKHRLPRLWLFTG